MRGSPSPIERFAYHAITLLILAAGLFQLVQILAFGPAALGIGELP